MCKPFLSLLLLPLLFSCEPNPQIEQGYVHVSNGDSIYYEIQGGGEPILFLHGHTLDISMWDPQMEFFASRFKVIRMDFRGYGQSSPQREGVQFTYQEDVLTLLDSLHLDKVHLVGLSMGSFVSSELVAMHPERFYSATLASGNIRNCKGPGEPMDSLELAKKEQDIAHNVEIGVETWKTNWIEQLVAGGGSNRETIRPSITRQVDHWNGWQLLHQECRLYYGLQAWDTLKTKCPDMPVLILSGRNEKKGPNPMLPYLPNGRQIIIEDCGHMTNMEKPDEFNRLVLENINRADNL